jgi:PTH1 family peptidyl-tRNA hydrolase
MFFRRLSTPPSGDLRLVVGLGNIGKQYDHTRHNVGFEVADLIAQQHGAHFRKGKFKGDESTITLDGMRVLLLKPHTLMNLSGEAVTAAARFYKIPPQRILVICDDINLPLGRIRVRAKGSDGGHNGLWSIIHRLGSQDFPRVRVGVGAPPPEMDMVSYVLSRFLTAERNLVQDAVSRAAAAVETWVKEGTESAMNRWNASPSSSDGKASADE